MKTKDFYLNKIKASESNIEQYRQKIKLLESPKPLKIPKGKTKIISFRVPVSRIEELRKVCADALIKALNKKTD